MNTIKLKSMSLMNFKGIRNLEVNFADITIISGANASGKTSIFDGFTWLLFGKDTNRRSDFNIKTLDENNLAIPRIDHEVSAVLDIDGKPIALRKVYKEKWSKKKGSEIAEMIGHTTDYYVNGVPMSESQYEERIDSIISESTFKGLTNPLHFNSMKWEDRRMVLTKIAGETSNESIAVGNPDFIELLNQLSGKTIEEYQREIASKKKLLKGELESIPTRIDEATRSMPAPVDYSAIEQEINTRSTRIKELEGEKLSLVTKNNEENAKIKSILDDKLKLQKELMSLRNDNKLKALNATSPIEMELKQANEKLAQINNLITSKENRITSINSQIQQLNEANNKDRELWVKVNAEEFVLIDAPTHCNTCKQSLPESELESYRLNAQTNFNTDKSNRLKNIQDAGIRRNGEIEQLKLQLQPLENEILELTNQGNDISISEIQSRLEAAKNAPIVIDPRETELESQINSIVVPEQIPVIDTTLEERSKLNAEIDGLKKQLASKEQLAQVKTRISELEKQQQEFAQQLANLEKTEFTIEQFNRLKMNDLEYKINQKFSLVKFRLFKTQINGGIEECCDCLVNGVPFSDVNTAGKINAGIDIINALIEHSGSNAPIWVDNCESINDVMPSSAQMVLLYVTTGKLSISQ